MSVDDLLMCLLNMGFELEDCQEAIQFGKLSVQEVIDWILAGKPRPSQSGATGGNTLKLGTRKKPDEVSGENVIGSNPFLNPQPVSPVQETGDQRSAFHSGGENMETEDRLQTRTMVNDEQRQVKARYEEKQRLELQKKMKEERLAKKKAKEQALAQIREDQERRKLLKTQKEGSSGSSIAQGASTDIEQETPPTGAPTASHTTTGQSQTTSQATAHIQIRLPEGRPLRERFTAATVLQEVWDFVVTKFHAAALGNFRLVQPFPHKEFGPDSMEITLADLGLVPNGSLVLNRVQSAPTQENPPMNLEDPEIETLLTAGKKKKLIETSLAPQPHQVPPPQASPSEPSHSWGEGHALQTDGGQEEQQEPMESASDDSHDEGAGMDIGPVLQQLPPNPHQLGGMLQGGAAIGGQDDHHAWGGGGHMLIDQMIDGNHLPHQQKDPKQLAAEAASQRFAQNPPQEKDAEMDTSPGVPTQEVPRLVQLLVQNVSQRVCDPRQPLTGLQGIPANIAIHVVNHLIKERLLKPKTLRPFISCHLTHLVLDCYPYVTNELLAGIRYHTSLQHLSLASCPLITDRGLQSIAGLSRLRFLSLAGCRQLTNNCLPILQELQSLVTVVLEDTGITDEGICQFALSSLPALHTLDLSRTQVSHQVFTALPSMPELRVLNMEGTQVSSLSGIQRLVRLEGLNVSNTQIVSDTLLCLQNHPTLTALNVSSTPNVVGDQALQYITGLHLQALNLPSRLTTSDEGMQYLAGMSLHTLDLTNYINVGDAGMEHIGKLLSLKKLRLGNTKVSDVGLLLLEGLKDLEELHLDRTIITNSGAAVISAFTRLQELSLSETCISDELLLTEVLHTCVMLSKLNLSKTAVTDKGVKKLSLPHLVLLNIDCTKIHPDTASQLQNCERLPALDRVIYTNLYPPTPQEEGY